MNPNAKREQQRASGPPAKDISKPIMIPEHNALETMLSPTFFPILPSNMEKNGKYEIGRVV
jgi:hypothetical protein